MPSLLLLQLYALYEPKDLHPLTEGFLTVYPIPIALLVVSKALELTNPLCSSNA